MNQLGDEIQSSIGEGNSFSTISSDGGLVCFVDHDGGQNAFLKYGNIKMLYGA